ncbi:hypothetical protein Hdeb2414_s0011g00364161 [Helianthus debilis subsp. tardiflorus]
MLTVSVRVAGRHAGSSQRVKPGRLGSTELTRSTPESTRVNSRRNGSGRGQFGQIAPV